MSAETTKEKRSQRPWVLLIEKASANGGRMELETTVFSRDDGIKDFLDSEARKVAGGIESLERKLLTVSRKKSSGRLRGLLEVSQIKEGIEEDINQKRATLGFLRGKGEQPIKIKGEFEMVGKQKKLKIVDWERSRGGEDLWAQYVRDEHPEILDFSTEKRALLLRIFMSKYNLMQRKRGAVDEYEELLHELRNKDPEGKLIRYREEISQRLSRR